MARNQKHYDTDYKVQSVNLAKEIGLSKAARELGIIQSMNSDGGRCHDNARCESMWARLKDELFYSRNLKSTDFTVVQLKKMVWRYFMSYWNNRRICSSNDGLPPKVKRDRYYAALPMAA
ncbi:integrase core domain-containing protein [uncultured Eubacterium sp.]|jgi:putative transposase|uniref:integrase core domain-containing protein n=1 Tax=uncultured Eubacterium sp. TaxID=165185 RepID=UPI0034A3E2D1